MNFFLTYWWIFLILFLIVLVILAWLLARLWELKFRPKTDETPQSENFFSDENLLRTLIDNMPDFIYIKDIKSRFVVANKKLAQVHGIRSPLEMAGKTDFDFYPKELANKYYWNEQEIIASGKPLINIEEQSLDETGETIYLSTTKIPLKDSTGKIIGLVGIGRDITLKKKEEELLAEHTKQLQKLNYTKDKFFSIIAHDLRNPFHSILGFTELLMRNYSDFDDAKKQEFVGLIYESSQHAHNLLENLLQWSRTQTDRIKYNPSKQSLSRIIDETAQVLNASLKKKGLIFSSEIQKDIFVYVDKNMIELVIRNLLSNAIKFTPSGGKISISAKDDGKFLVVSISDTGVGIDPEDLHRLFQFEEFHTTTGTAGEPGTGLGLIICQEFIKKHSGEITIKSELDKGSTFTFTLPKAD
jgi:two-component system, sensor histidine kinase and response regulator